MSDENIKVEKVDAQPVIDAERDMVLVNAWYAQAKQVRDLEGLSKLITALLGDVRYTGGTTPHVYTVIALAALKLANESKHGKLSDEQWRNVAEFIGYAMTNDLMTEPVVVLG